MSEFILLVRQSVTRPKEAAQFLLGLHLSNAMIAQAALLLAILSVLLRYALYSYVALFSNEAASLTFPPVYLDLAQQFLGVYLVAYITIFLARGAGVRLGFAQSAAIYIWYNLMLTIGGFVMLAGFYLLGGLALLLSLAIAGWAIWAAAHFWTVLIQSDNLFLGFILALFSIILASAISVVIAGILDLPVLEFSTDV